MAHCHIVPVPAAAKDGPTVLLEVKQTGKRPLDIQLVGCEGENPYVTTLQQHNLEQLMRKFKGSNAEWEAILSHFLLQTQPEGGDAKALDDVNMVYTLDGDDLTIIIRRDVKGIKMTLGEITLPKDEEFEINPFDWALASAEAHTFAVKELADLKIKINDSQSTIDQLTKQLEDFLEAKRQTENEMLEKFKVLLNEKKKKIRDQQRLLAGAKVDKATASAVQSTRVDTAPRKAGPSRTSKRKAAVKEEPVVSQVAPDQMEVEPSNADDETEDDEQMQEASTPDRMSDEDTEDKGLESPKESAPQAKRQSPDRANARASRATKTSNAAQTRAEPPPRRELPFGRPATRSKPAKKQPSPPPEDDEETEDEEL